MRLSLLGLLVGLLSVVSALSAAGNKLLVVIEEEAEKAKYSQFWSDLQQRGFQITYHSPKDTGLSLFQHGETAYSHLLLLPVKSKALGPALTPNLLVEFVNAGSNILLALSAEQAVPVAISSLLLELDISISPDRSSLTVDHFNYDSKSAADKHDVLVLSSAGLPRQNVKNFFSVDGLIALPRAVGQVLGNASPYLSPILRAPSTAYTYNPKEEAEAIEDPFATGSQLSLVSAFQARNSARFTVLGSAEALEDKWFSASVKLPGDGKKDEKTANQAFAQKLSAWTFKELGVLKVGEVQHYLNEEPSSRPDLNPSIYRIKNKVHYSIAMSEWTMDHWTPFKPAAGDDVQLEFSMLSPFHRLNLLPSTTDTNSTIYSADFKLPDQHGIFNFFVEYRRPFLTNVEEKRTVTVRHFAHDEWPRSFVISSAWPWISGIWVTVAGWVVFSALCPGQLVSETTLQIRDTNLRLPVIPPCFSITLTCLLRLPTPRLLISPRRHVLIHHAPCGLPFDDCIATGSLIGQRRMQLLAGSGCQILRPLYVSGYAMTCSVFTKKLYKNGMREVPSSGRGRVSGPSPQKLYCGKRQRRRRTKRGPRKNFSIATMSGDPAAAAPPNGIVFFHYPSSPYARRVCWYLALRNISYAECVRPPSSALDAFPQQLQLTHSSDPTDHNTAAGPRGARGTLPAHTDHGHRPRRLRRHAPDPAAAGAALPGVRGAPGPFVPRHRGYRCAAEQVRRGRERLLLRCGYDAPGLARGEERAVHEGP
nr:dolichyl-diphosphooligosaccharide--protein glycosyltransferase subunit wbp1 [Quercus suber]